MNLFLAILLLIVTVFVLALLYLGAGALVTFFLVKRRPDLFEYQGEFFVLVAVFIIGIWPLALFAIVAAYAMKPLRAATQTRFK
jgi:hypothetical protein